MTLIRFALLIALAAPSATLASPLLLAHLYRSLSTQSTALKQVTAQLPQTGPISELDSKRIRLELAQLEASREETVSLLTRIESDQKAIRSDRERLQAERDELTKAKADLASQNIELASAKKQLELQNSSLSLQKASLTSERDALTKQKNELEGRERLFSMGFYASFTAALIALFALFGKLPTVLVERKLKLAELEAKYLEMQKLRHEIARNGV